MKLRPFIFLLSIMLLSLSKVKASGDDFPAFANHQAELMQTAYEKRDVKAYGKLLDELKDKYDHLDAMYKRGYVH